MKKYIFLLFIQLTLFCSLYAQDLVAPYSSQAPLCDGIIDANDPWSFNWVSLDAIPGGSISHDNYSAQFQILHSAKYIYIVVKVQDETVGTSGFNSYENDCSDLYFSMETATSDFGAYKEGCWDFRTQRVYNDKVEDGYFDGASGKNSYSVSTMLESSEFKFGTYDTGSEYVQEFILPKSVLAGKSNFDNEFIRFDIQVANNDGMFRSGQRFWHSNSDSQWNNTNTFGIVKLEHKSIDLSKLEIEENAPVNTLVGTLFLPDNSDSINYTFAISDLFPDNDQFIIKNNQLLSTNTFDYEAKKSYEIQISGTDLTGEVYISQFEINIINVPEIQLSNYSINENEATGHIIGHIAYLNGGAEDSTNSYVIVPDVNTDYGSFYLEEKILKANEIFNYEIKKDYSIILQQNDEIIDAINIHINDINDPPSNINLSRSSVTISDINKTLVGLLSSVDEDEGETFTYSFISGDGDSDNDKFLIEANELHFNPDNEFINATYRVRIQTEDHQGITFSKSFNIKVTTINEAPTNILLSKSVIDENSPIGSVIGLLSTVDANQDDAHTYSLVTGDLDTNNESFKIEGDQLLVSEVFDYESKSVYTVRIQTKDKGGKSFSKALLISVNNVTETSVEQINAIEQCIKVYPNPVSNGIINIKHYSEISILAELINVDGKIVLKQKLNFGTNQILISQFPSGTYILKFSSDHKVSFQQKILNQ